jgi:integrase
MAVYQRSGKWYADFYIGGATGRRVRRSAPSRELAKELEREWKTREFRGESLEEATEHISLHNLIGKYRKLHESGNALSTRKRDDLVFAKAKNTLGNPMLAELTLRHFEEYKADRLETVKPGTVNLELRVLRSLFTRAVEWGYLKDNPVRLVRQLRIDQKEPRFLTLDESRKLIEAADGQMKTFVALALHTGLRRGELVDLQWDDISLRKRELRVRRSKGKRFRVVPLNKIAHQHLAKNARHASSPFVFHRSSGNQWVEMRKPFWKALDRAGLPRIRIHDLRHSFISNLIASGVDVRAAQELAGHRDIQTTMRYAHLAPGRLRASVDVLTE